MTSEGTSEIKFLIVNTVVVTVDNNFTIFDTGWISIEGEKISDLGPGDPPQAVSYTHLTLPTKA